MPGRQTKANYRSMTWNPDLLLVHIIEAVEKERRAHPEIAGLRSSTARLEGALKRTPAASSIREAWEHHDAESQAQCAE